MKNIKQSFWKDTNKTKLIIYLSKTVKTRLCSKENFREHFGLSSILVKAPRLQSWPPEKKFRGALGAPKHSSWGAQASQVGRLSTSDEEVFCTHTNLTGLLITKLGNGRLEKRESGIRNRNGNRNMNWNRNRNRNRNGKRNLYKNRDNIYLNLSFSGFNSYSDYIRKIREKIE